MRITPSLTGLALAGVLAGPAFAHHPGSHATRQADGRVRVEVAALATDACTSFGPVTAGAPTAVTPAPGTLPVSAQLLRPAGPLCAQAVTRVAGEAMFEVAPDVRQIMLYIVGPDGTVASTERVQIR
jgi:hypothetical protein